MSGSGYALSLTLPTAAVPAMEAALEVFGGALVIGNPDSAGAVSLDLYLEAAPTKEDLMVAVQAASTAANIAPPAVSLAALPETDWVAESQKGLPALRAGRFFLYGSHYDDAFPSDAFALLVEANAAFGTGRHESTKGCLLALSTLAKRHRFNNVLDMGCGSGVLAMAAARLWPCRVLAVDNDPVAVRVAATNAVENAVARQIRTACSDGYRDATVTAQGPYDLILANILAEPLTAMALDLQRHMAADGIAVLSGLLNSQARQVQLRHRDQGLILRRRIRLGDWTTLILQRPR